MCRNIRPLHNFDPPATEEEIRSAALQYVRKISGYNKPSQANAEAFDRAVDEVAAASARLLDALTTTAPPKDREAEAAKARARAQQRYAAYRRDRARSAAQARDRRREDRPDEPGVDEPQALQRRDQLALRRALALGHEDRPLGDARPGQAVRRPLERRRVHDDGVALVQQLGHEPAGTVGAVARGLLDRRRAHDADALGRRRPGAAAGGRRPS